MRIVMKFGGTSVGSVEALQQVVEIVQRARQDDHAVIVVVSAMSGVTNLLLHAARQAETGDEQTAAQARADIEQKHAAATRHFLGEAAEREAAMADISQLLDEFEALCHGICVLGELTPRALDVIGGLGERMSVVQMAAILSKAGVPAQAVAATELIVTDDHFGGAIPLIEQTAHRTQTGLNSLLEQGVTPVVTGFIGATEDGIQTTLGRGGSDYSATIIGRAIKADEVWIWTDVNGVMTADPRLVPEAHPIARLSYAEVSELSYFGAKVLHAQAIRPARREAFPVRILNTFNPDHPGTLISADSGDSDQPVKAVTAIKNMSLVTVEGPGMVGIPGVAGRVFSTVARAKTSIMMISQASSEQSICFVIPAGDVGRVTAALQQEFVREIERRDIDRINAVGNIVVLAVVGANMKGVPGVSGRVFGVLGQEAINVIAIAQGSSEYNISLVISQDDADRAVRTIHGEFALG